MARAPKSGKSGPTEVVATTLILPSPKTVTELAKEKRNTKKRVQSQNGTLGELIGKAVEQKHLDRKAFSLACQLEGMDDERLHVTYHHLLEYLEMLGVTKRATAQEEMFAARGPKDKEAEVDDDKVTPIGRAARKVVEAAGDEFKSTH